MANEFIIKNGFHSKGDSQVTGSLDVSGHLFFSASENSSTSYKTLVINPTTGKVFKTGSYGGGGGGTFPFTGDAVITGSLTVDASSSTSQSLSVIGSGSVVFDVIGSVGTLLEIDDDLSGTLFTANDQNGIPSFEVSASGEVYLGRAPQSLYTTVQKGPFTGVTAIFSYPTSSFTTFFINYTAYSEDNIQVGKTFVSIIPGIAGFPTATGTLTAQNQISGRQLLEWLRFKPVLNNGIITYYASPDSGFEDVYFKAIIKGI